MKSLTLTLKQQRFCDEYLKSVNGKSAAVRAGYSPKTAAKNACKLLKLPKIQEYLSEKRTALSKELNLDGKQILEEYARIAFFDVGTLYDDNDKLLPLSELAPATKAAIGIEVVETNTGAGDTRIQAKRVVKVSLQSKLAALGALAKHLGLFEKGNQPKQEEDRYIVYVGDQLISRT